MRSDVLHSPPYIQCLPKYPWRRQTGLEEATVVLKLNTCACCCLRLTALFFCSSYWSIPPSTAKELALYSRFKLRGEMPATRRKRDIFLHADFNLRHLFRLAGQLRGQPCTCNGSQSVTGFPLHHHDITLQNLFVDDDLKITCVIDWAFSSTVPPAQLLATPGLPHPRGLVLDLSLVSAFCSGF